MESKYDQLMERGKFAFRVIEKELIELQPPYYCEDTGYKIDIKSFTEREKNLMILAIGMFKQTMEDISNGQDTLS